MQTTISASESPIKDLFSDKYIFNIPKYQRPYAWTTEEAGELLDDLLGYVGDGSKSLDELPPYFLGSIVLVKKQHDPQAEVVDGQQRLITLTILFSVLRELMPQEQGKGLTKFLCQEGNPIAGTEDQYRLVLRERDADFFREHIQAEGMFARLETLNTSELTDSRLNMHDNAKAMKERLEDVAPELRVKLAQFIANNCYLVAVSTPDLSSAYRIFSVLNDRGMDLSHSDILKAEVIGEISEDKQNQYTTKWESIEDEIGRDSFKELFVHIRTIKLRRKLRKTVLEEIREGLNPSKAPMQFIDEWLEPYADALADVTSQAYQGGQKATQINNYLVWLNKIDNFDWIPPALYFLAKNKNQEDSLVRFFEKLERLAAGMMIIRSNINERVERYAGLLEAIDNGNLWDPDSPLELTSSEKKHIGDTLNGDLYLITRIRLYVLLRLDTELSAGGAAYNHSIITVEHVLPQTPAENSQWKNWFNDAEHEQWVHRIGNLVLLPRRKNSQASNYEFDIKKSKYFSTSGGISNFVITTQVINETDWTPHVLQRRQNEQMDKLKKIWSL